MFPKRIVNEAYFVLHRFFENVLCFVYASLQSTWSSTNTDDCERKTVKQLGQRLIFAIENTILVKKECALEAETSFALSLSRASPSSLWLLTACCWRTGCWDQVHSARSETF